MQLASGLPTGGAGAERGLPGIRPGSSAHRHSCGAAAVQLERLPATCVSTPLLMCILRGAENVNSGRLILATPPVLHARMGVSEPVNNHLPPKKEEKRAYCLAHRFRHRLHDAGVSRCCIVRALRRAQARGRLQLCLNGCPASGRQLCQYRELGHVSCSARTAGHCGWGVKGMMLMPV